MDAEWVNTKKGVNEITDDLLKKLESVWMRLPPSEEIVHLAHERLLAGYRNYVEAFLEEQQKISVKHQILVLRQHIDRMWKQCCFTDLQKEVFAEYSSTNFSELSLDTHKQYLSSLELLYKNNELCFNSANKYGDLWEHLKNLDKQLSDPHRLFTNRGAQLLKNEKDRKEGRKELSQLEADLVRLATQHEEKYGSQLLIHGQTVVEWLQKFKPVGATGSACKSRVRPWQTGMVSTGKKRSCASGSSISNEHIPTKQCKRSLHTKVNNM